MTWTWVKEKKLCVRITLKWKSLCINQIEMNTHMHIMYPIFFVVPHFSILYSFFALISEIQQKSIGNWCHIHTNEWTKFAHNRHQRTTYIAATAGAPKRIHVWKLSAQQYCNHSSIIIEKSRFNARLGWDGGGSHPTIEILRYFNACDSFSPHQTIRINRGERVIMMMLSYVRTRTGTKPKALLWF